MLLKFVRNRTSSIVVLFIFVFSWFYGILLKHWIFVNERRNHIAIWNWIQRFGLCNIKKRKIVFDFYDR